jgi:hypothetical protein
VSDCCPPWLRRPFVAATLSMPAACLCWGNELLVETTRTGLPRTLRPKPGRASDRVRLKCSCDPGRPRDRFTREQDSFIGSCPLAATKRWLATARLSRGLLDDAVSQEYVMRSVAISLVLAVGASSRSPNRHNAAGDRDSPFEVAVRDDGFTFEWCGGYWMPKSSISFDRAEYKLPFFKNIAAPRKVWSQPN